VSRYLFDTESNGFVKNATKVHCIGIINVDSGDEWDFGPSRIPEAIGLLSNAQELIGHNIMRHDLPLLTKLHGWKPRAAVNVRDTMVMSRLIYPNLKATDAHLVAAGKLPSDLTGKHSIGAWGYRLGEHKGDYAQIRRAQALALGITDEEAIVEYVWGTWNEDMHEYMKLDCRVNYALWKKLKPDQYPQKPLDLEHRVSRVCDAIQEAGVPFDVKAAQALHVTLMGRQHELETKLKAEFGFWYQPVSPDPTKSLFTPKRDNKTLGYVAGQPMTKLKLVEFNPGSRDHIARKLMERGWKPEKFTDGGKPQLDEETIESIVARYPEMAGLGELLMVEKRISQLVGAKQSLLNTVQEDGRIHGSINPMGTITSRASHFAPNLGQVPSAKKPYGSDFRRLFVPAKPGWVMVGADMAALELRGLGHYLAYYDGGAYGKVVLDGDPHWTNVEAMGLVPQGTERDKHNKLHTILREDGAKRFIYAYVYGAGDEMCGSIIYEALTNAKNNAGPEGEALYREFFPKRTVEGYTFDDVNSDVLRKVGGKVRKGFAKRIKGFGTLQAALGERVESKGYVKGLDQRITPIRASHSALNFVIQGAGAILCKRWLADAFEECSANFKIDEDFQFVLWIHDELQVICRAEIADQIGAVLVRCAQQAGADYGFKLPLDSEYVIGSSWAETH
jgi:DNA polymerase I